MVSMEKYKLFLIILFSSFCSYKSYKFSLNWKTVTTATESSVRVTTQQFNNSLTLYGPVYYSSFQEERLTKEKKTLKKSKPDDFLTNVRMFMGRIPLLKRSLGKECWEEIGCFSAVTFNDVVNGYIAMLPMGPEEIDPTFYLVKSETEEPLALKHNFFEDDLRQSSFDPELITVVVIHGFYKGIEEWMIKIFDNLKKVQDEDFNYIFVDWSKGSKVFNFALAAANCQVVGALIAYFIDRVCNTYKDRGLTRERFHLIGHSLGAHTAGFAGKRLTNPKVSRITGLDPAGPGFRDKKAEHRLDFTDASQVVVIHTDMAQFVTKGLGIYEPIGDIDFYPNGGKHQPGCPESEVLENVLKAVIFEPGRDFSCSHNRAPIILYTPDNLDAICQPIGYYCDDWETFLEGRCANCQTYNELKRCQLMGLFPFYWENVQINKANKNSNKFYLNTGRYKNVCIFHYQMAFHFSNDSDYITKQRFSLKIRAEVGPKQRILSLNRTLSQSMNGNIHTLLVTFNFAITKIISMNVEWMKPEDDILTFKSSKIGIHLIEINYMSHYRADIRKDLSAVLCPVTDGVVQPGIEINNYIICENNMEPKVSALRLTSNQMTAFTDRADIITTDFENQEILAGKMTQVPGNRWFSSLSQPIDEEY